MLTTVHLKSIHLRIIPINFQHKKNTTSIKSTIKSNKNHEKNYWNNQQNQLEFGMSYVNLRAK